jgi:hypothetical protein
MLSDKFSVVSGGDIDDVVEKILRAIYQDRRESEEWSPISYVLPDSTELIMLPVRPKNSLGVGIAKHPVTNSQYQQFMYATGHHAPLGETFIDGKWQGPFSPLDDPEFNDPQQPVVCVDANDALDYCRWLNGQIWLKELRGKESLVLCHSRFDGCSLNL